MTDATSWHATDSVQAALLTGGPKEINTLSQELNKMSFEELKAFSRTMTAVSREEQAANPDLPTLRLSGGAGGDSKGNYTEDVLLSAEKPNGTDKLLYERGQDFTNGVTTDIKYQPGTEKEASRQVIPTTAGDHRPLN